MSSVQREQELKRKVQSSVAVWAGLADGVFSASLGSATAHSLSLINIDQVDQVSKALGNLQIDGSTFSHAVPLVSQGYQNWVAGQVGERIAASTLSHSGHWVRFAETPNQTGWDLIVDGIPTQVKVGHYAVQHVVEHLEKYPHIPVVTDLHTAALLHHPMVSGLADLAPEPIHALASKEIAWNAALSPQHVSGGQVLTEGFSSKSDAAQLHASTYHDLTFHTGHKQSVASAHHAVGAHHLNNVHHAGGVHLPWITIGVSAWREVKLSEKYGGNFAESLGSIAADAVGIGVGAKAGALAGALFGPLGAIVGAVAGGMIGRGAVQSGRRANYEAEFETFKKTIAKDERDIESQLSEFGKLASEINSKAQAKLKPQLDAIANEYKVACLKLLKQRRSITVTFATNCIEGLEKSITEIQSSINAVDSKYPKRNLVLRLLIPSRNDYMRVPYIKSLETSNLRATEAKLKLQAAVADLELQSSSDETSLVNELQSVLALYKHWPTSFMESFTASLSEVNHLVRSLEDKQQEATKRSIDRIRVSERHVRSSIEKNWVATLNILREQFKDADRAYFDLARKASRAGVLSAPSPNEVLNQLNKSVLNEIQARTSGSMKYENWTKRHHARGLKPA